jgi:Zn-dependent peptidase ImmA (M78 family)/transcriptional regulator with XRE-family HTH domain
MARRVEARVKPELLVWARETAGYSVLDAAKKAKVQPHLLTLWENEVGHPSIPQLRKLANVYKRPLAVFFLAAPPATPAPLHDFRRLPSEASPGLSPELLLEMRRARRRRAIALELLDEAGQSAPELPLRGSLNDDPDTLAETVRSWVGVSLSEQSEWVGDYDALNGWVAAFERLGVLVFQTGDVPLDEMRGFSLNERVLPVIVLNAKDSQRGRVFTMMHELVHLFVSGGGICDPLRIGRLPRNQDEQVEVFCNRVAGAILVPTSALLTDPRVTGTAGPRQWDDMTIGRLADRFAVSDEVILRRLLILGRTTDEFYEQKRDEYLARYRLAAARARERGGFAPLPVVTVRDHGRRFTRLVLDALERDRITLADASDYLGVQLKHLEAITSVVERVERRG